MTPLAGEGFRITRGKRLVVLVGQRKAVAIAVRNVSGRRRWVQAERMAGPQGRGGKVRNGLAPALNLRRADRISFA